MYMQWVGIVPFIGLILMGLLIIGGVFLILKSVMIIHINSMEKNKVALYKPLGMMLTYSLLLVLFKQAIGFGFIVFSSTTSELCFNILTSLVTMVFALYILKKVLNLKKELADNSEVKKKPTNE